MANGVAIKIGHCQSALGGIYLTFRNRASKKGMPTRMSKPPELPISSNPEDFNRHTRALQRAEEIIRLQTWRASEQQKSIGLTAAALPILTIKKSLKEIFAQRGGVDNTRVNERDVQVATNLLANLIATTSHMGPMTAVEVSNHYDYHRNLTPGEMWILQIKQRGFAINFPTEIGANNLLVQDFETWSIVNFVNGVIKLKGFTSSWNDFEDSEGNVILPKSGGKPKTVAEVVALYDKIAKSKQTASGIRCTVLHARTSLGDNEFVALVFVREMESKSELDLVIHGGKQARLNEIDARVSNMSQQASGRLQDKDLKIAREAVERAKLVSDFSNPSELATVLEILMQIPAFDKMGVGAQGYILSELYNAVWVGTGNFGAHNPRGVGLNSRP